MDETQTILAAGAGAVTKLCSNREGKLERIFNYTVIYGYLWDEKREHWLVDEEAAEVVRRIFSLTLEGYVPYQIACKLSADRIEIPVVHLARFNAVSYTHLDVYKRQVFQLIQGSSCHPAS